MKKSTILGFAVTSTALAIIALATLGNLNIVSDTTLTGNYSTVTISGVGSAENYVEVDGGGFTVQCLRLSGKYIKATNFIVTGCSSHGVLITGQNIEFTNSVVKNNVTENGTTKCSGAGGWGSAVKIAQGSQYVKVDGNQVYQNCGEGIASTKTGNFVISNNLSFDNFSLNIYVDNSNDGLVTDNTTYYTGNTAYYRNADVGSCIGLGIETYAGWTNRLTNITISNNFLSNCKGIGLWNEAGISPSNVSVFGNVFSNVRPPLVKVTGVVGTGNFTATPTRVGTVNPTNTPTITYTPTFTRTPTTTLTKTSTPVVSSTPTTGITPTATPTRRCIPVIGTDLNGLFCY